MLFGSVGWRHPRVVTGAIATGVVAMLAAGCTTSDFALPTNIAFTAQPSMYAQIQDGGYTIPAVPPGRVEARYLRQVVRTPGRIAGAAEPGTIVVDPGNRYLYLVQANGTSMRSGIGVGREGFAWTGEAVIRGKQQWPRWHPPAEMMARDPEAAKYPNGMDGGLQNPLGARALYLWQGNRDTLSRLHGTNDPSSIGKAVSSGCVRLMNQDVIDLYERVPIGTKVVVLDSGFSLPPLPSLPSLPLADIFGPRPVGAGPVPPANVGQI
jgi:lipoprotein-anchoring transpeptidase ErfK/SrfK